MKNKNKKLEVELLDEYIAEFENEFNVKCKDKIPDTNVLNSMFQNFINERLKYNQYEQFASEKIIDVERKLLKTLTKEQKQIYKEIELLCSLKSTNKLKQAFIYGVCLDAQIRNEKENYIKK